MERDEESLDLSDLVPGCDVMYANRSLGFTAAEHLARESAGPPRVVSVLMGFEGGGNGM